ncbi:MAG: flavodoxin domain-containing protein [Anaerolineae bacterium]|nr:flavodoxin domain-containing protein [Anaerolineae bacterium]MCO5195733.1 flavodoxin domain-containing protein [Anaerolineae bacterium]MCO5206940.1 flavodoxin domain-containing protein [Anaerolineae bacterium]
MNIAIVYDSSTGTTAQAAQTMGVMLEQHGHQCTVESVSTADPATVKAADLICVGGWVKGLFIIRQHPSDGAMRFIKRLGKMDDKKTLVFCTYKSAIGSTLRQMSRALVNNGAQVIEQFKFRGAEPNRAFAAFAASVDDV